MDISQLYIIFFAIFIFLFLDYTHSADFFPRKGFIHNSSTGVSYPRIDPTKVFQLSWHPRAFVFKGFLTDEECDHLIQMADKLERAQVVDEKGHIVDSEYRTSYGKFLEKAQDKIVAGIEARIAAWTMLPEENGEAIQILRYRHGQKFDPHHDNIDDEHNEEIGGPRIATVLMYLSNVKKGGETVFPASEDTQLKDDSWSDCGKLGTAVKPRKGDALLFFSLKLDVTSDETSEHSSCPVIEGEKWSATKWIRARSFEADYKPEEHVGAGCADNHHDCAFWTANGECRKNPRFMIGSGGSIGQCRKSCKVCL